MVCFIVNGHVGGHFENKPQVCVYMYCVRMTL